jgi:hypothetical protein
MKVIGQPESYSEMLERIFVTTLVTGFLCTVSLAQASPSVHELINRVSANADIGPVKGVKALYVLIPLGIAVIARAILLHDKISDVLRIRRRFDVPHILVPMAGRLGFPLGDSLFERLKTARINAMYAVFYPYAGFADPAIDRQLVRTALDTWGWFWSALEAVFLIVITGIVFLIIGSWKRWLVTLLILVPLILFLFYQWSVCKRTASAEVDAILQDGERAEKVRSYFAKVMIDH